MDERREIGIFGRREYSVAVVALVVVLANVGLYTYVGLAPALIIGGSLVLALFAWLFTTYRQPADPDRVLPLYLLLIVAELLHMAEEYLTSFPEEFSALTGAHMTQDVFVVVFVMGGVVLALLAAVGVMYRNPLANYVLWFVIVGPGFVNGIAHLLFPLMAGTVYFPGLLTVALPVAIGIVLALRIYRDSRGVHETSR